jgi:hypothetical protein
MGTCVSVKQDGVTHMHVFLYHGIWTYRYYFAGGRLRNVLLLDDDVQAGCLGTFLEFGNGLYLDA